MKHISNIRPIRKRQAGWVMISVMIAMMLLAIAASNEMRRDHEKKLDRNAELVGQGIARNAGAVNNFLSRDYDAFIKNELAPGDSLTVNFKIGNENKSVTLAHWDAPTMAELAALEVGLPPNSTSISPNGGVYRIKVTKSPEGCTGTNCNIEGLVWASNPLSDIPRAAIAMRAIGNDGAMTTLQAPNLLNGYRGGWKVPSPVNAAGIVAARVGYGASAWSPYFRIDGTKNMAADANIGGHAVVNTSEVLTTMKTVGDPCAEIGAIAGGISNGKGAAFVCRENSWQLAGGKTANAGEDCSPEGSTATAITTDESLVCKNGKYVKLMSLVARNVEKDRLLVRDGQVVPKPTCDVNGVPDYSFNLNAFSVDVTEAPPKQAVYITTTENGTASWSVVLRLRDDAGGEVSGNTYSLTAVMHLECKY